MCATFPLREFVEKACIPAIEANSYARRLRPGTQRQYAICLRHYAAQVGKTSIKNAVTIPSVKKHLQAIAVECGNPTARQTAKVVSRYVMNELVQMEVTDRNPLLNRTFDVTVGEDDDAPAKKPQGGHALLPGERRRVVDHLLGLDPTMPGRQWHSAEEQTAKRALIIDATLLQATCGFRIGEIRQMRASWLGVDDKGRLTITVPADVSKTHRARTIPVMDERVAERVRERAQRPSDARDALVFPAPGLVRLGL